MLHKLFPNKGREIESKITIGKPIKHRGFMDSLRFNKPRPFSNAKGPVLGRLCRGPSSKSERGVCVFNCASNIFISAKPKKYTLDIVSVRS